MARRTGQGGSFHDAASSSVTHGPPCDQAAIAMRPARRRVTFPLGKWSEGRCVRARVRMRPGDVSWAMTQGALKGMGYRLAKRGLKGVTQKGYSMGVTKLCTGGQAWPGTPFHIVKYGRDGGGRPCKERPPRGREGRFRQMQTLPLAVPEATSGASRLLAKQCKHLPDASHAVPCPWESGSPGCRDAGVRILQTRAFMG